MITIYAVRHGQAEHNVAHVFNVRNNPVSNLTSKGKLQAVDTSFLLTDKGITHIFSSQITRAVQTAEIINAKQNLKIKQTPLINEFDSGYHGKNVYWWVASYILHGFSLNRALGNSTESLNQAKTRVADLLQQINKLPDGSVVCLVAHKHTLQALCSIINGDNYRLAVLLPKKNAEYIKFET